MIHDLTATLQRARAVAAGSNGGRDRWRVLRLRAAELATADPDLPPGAIFEALADDIPEPKRQSAYRCACAAIKSARERHNGVADLRALAAKVKDTQLRDRILAKIEAIW